MGIIVYSLAEHLDETQTLLEQLEKFCRYLYTGDMPMKSADANYADILSHLLFDTDLDIDMLVSPLLPTYKRLSAASSPYIAVHFVPNSDKLVEQAYVRFGRE